MSDALDQPFDVSVARLNGEVLLRLESPERNAIVALDEEAALKLLIQLGRAALHVEETDPNSLALLKPALVARHPVLAWGAIDDGLIALCVFLPGLKPVMAAFDDDQARDILEGLEKVLSVPRERRVPTTPRH